jgi:anti-sigma regulatory factor (Ser/Thr protein kinase)
LDEEVEFSITLPATASNIATTRRFLAHVLVLCNSRANEADAALVLSELASNALEHGRIRALSVLLRVDGKRLTIAVADESSSEPRLRESAGPNRSGRGLLIVDRVAMDWGWSFPADERKIVWAALEAGPS